jgi:hypothetical protein
MKEIMFYSLLFITLALAVVCVVLARAVFMLKKTNDRLNKAHIDIEKKSLCERYLVEHIANSNVCRKVAHEFKNPLSAIMLASEIAQLDRCHPECQAHYQTIHRRIAQLANKLATLLKNEEKDTP